MPASRRPQVESAPALTRVNLPEGGLAAPKLLSPQQARRALALTPQAKKSPALTCLNLPGGGFASL